MGSSTSRRDVAVARGFTLIELMITVAIIAVLALLAGVGYARWIRTSKTGEATATIGAIKAAEETYRSEKTTYLDVSGCSSGTSVCSSMPAFYPTSNPTDVAVAWNPSSCASGTPVCANFVRLGAQAPNNVYYRYGVAAGSADGTSHTFDGRAYPAPYDPWFVVKAWGDLNNNGTPAYYWSSSFDSTTWNQNPDE